MPTQPQRDEFLLLAQKVCDETITPEERDQLESLLQEVPEFRKDYLDYLGVNAALISRYRTGGADDRPMRTPRPTAGRLGLSGGRFTAWATLFAITACLLVMANRFWPDEPAISPQAGLSDTTRHGSVATLRDSSVAVWRDEEQPINVGDRFSPGELRLGNGNAEFVLDSGVRLLLEGPAHIDIANPDEAFLHSGKVAVQVPEAAIGFTLLTPTSKLIDQGTEFGVVAEESGATEVHVFRGQVDLVYMNQVDTDTENRLALTDRQARRVIENNSQGQGIDFSLDRFRGLADRINKPVKWPIARGGNGHYYQLVFFDNSVTWQEAAADAFARHHKGMPGHLATVTSEEEHRFIVDQLLEGREIDNAWFGLTDVLREGFYQWITGEPFTCEHWGVDPVPQPDNFIERPGHGGEDYGTYSQLPGYGWFWNDLSNDSVQQSVAVALVEYEPPPKVGVENSMLSVPVTWKEKDGGNGHVYRLALSLKPLSWEELSRRAESTSVLGSTGRLASLETDEEREFVVFDILKVCGISENVLGLTGGSEADSLRWTSGQPLGEVPFTKPIRPADDVYGLYRWYNQEWALFTVSQNRAPPRWFGYLIEYPLSERADLSKRLTPSPE